METRLNIALADYNEKARRDREKSAASPFKSGGNMGGGTLAAKVAGKIAADQAASESSAADEAIAPANDTPASDAINTDADGSPWFDSSGEDAYLGEQARTVAAAEPPPRSNADDEEDAADAAAGKELPPMDTLVARVPAEARQILEDLFNARFVKVRKILRKSID